MGSINILTSVSFSVPEQKEVNFWRHRTKWKTVKSSEYTKGQIKRSSESDSLSQQTSYVGGEDFIH